MGNCFSYGIILSSASFFPRTSIDDVPQEICRRVEKVFSLLLSTKVDTVLSDYVTEKLILWKSKMLWKNGERRFYHCARNNTFNKVKPTAKRCFSPNHYEHLEYMI